MQWYGPERERELIAAIEAGVKKAGMKLTNNIKRSMGKDAGGSRSGHIASLPGAPPNVESGTLMRSIDAERPQHVGNTITTRVGSRGVTYAPYLEYGTSKMEARPYMRPALAKFKPELVAILGEIKL